MGHFLSMKTLQLPKTNSETIVKAIKDCLIRFSLPLSHCRGQAYDGASNMSGYLNGVAAQIKKMFPQHYLYTASCIAQICVYSQLAISVPLSEMLWILLWKFHSWFITHLSNHPSLKLYKVRYVKKGADDHALSTPEDYFRKQYFEVLDLLINELDRRFR